MEKIGLQKMEFYAYHGYYEEERRVGSRYQVDIAVELDLDIAHWSDTIVNTANYEDIHKICHEEMQNQYKLIESVAIAIAQKIKKEIDIVHTVDITVKKLNPPIYGHIGNAFVNIKL